MRTTGRTQRALGRRRLGRRDAEVLLDALGGSGAAGAAASGGPAGAPQPVESELEDLRWLLDAAAGPALAAELSGEDAARAVFSAHHSASATPSKERRVFSKALLGKAITVKIAAAVCGVSVVGVATAAETNSLPSSWQTKAHSALGSVGVPAPKTTSARGADQDKTKKDTDAQGSSHPGATGSAAAKPGQDKDDQNALDAAGARLLGDDGFRLCRAVEDGDRDDHGVDLNTAELQKLAKAANVPTAEIAQIKSRLDAQKSEAQKRMQDFCDRLAQAEKDARQGRTPKFPVPLPHPGDGWPTTWPSQLPTSGLPSKLPSGLPTGLPSNLPSHLPTGLPSHLPSNLPTGWPTGWPVDGGGQNPVDPIHPQH